MSKMNRLATAHNQYQRFERFPRVLCVCSAGLLRSPTVAWVLSNEPFNFNTRAVGASAEYAMMELDDVNISWSDHVVFMEKAHKKMAEERFPALLAAKATKVHVLDLPDDFPYRDPQLVELAKKKLLDVFHDVLSELGNLDTDLTVTRTKHK